LEAIHSKNRAKIRNSVKNFHRDFKFHFKKTRTMIILISPSKSLDFEKPNPITETTSVDFPKETSELVKKLQSFSVADIRQLMNLSDNLAILNYERYQNWQKEKNPKISRAALHAFQGDVYQGLEADTFNEEDLEFAQKHLRILSGLYGLIKPFDLIQPYRLEMGTSLHIKDSSNLYEFWGDKITQKINEQISKHEQKIVINLASQEYFKAVKDKKIESEIITPHFKEQKGDKYKVVSFYAKKARGVMSAYIIKHRIQDAKLIKDFDWNNYQFNEKLSTETDWIFTR